MFTLKERCTVEAAITARVVGEVVKRGGTCGIWEGAECLLDHTSNVQEILILALELDECSMTVRIPQQDDSEENGGILFVYGNGGVDCLADYNTHIAYLVEEANELANAISAGEVEPADLLTDPIVAAIL